MDHRRLGRTGLTVSPIGFGAFKIGRAEGTKYPAGYELPDDASVTRLLNGVLDSGINLIDTAPAYGLSEERIGRAIAHRRDEYVLSTKVGETFENGQSTYDFSSDAIRRSVARSLQRLNTEVIDVLLIHSDGNDLQIQNETDAVATVQELRDKGLAKSIGFSGKTVRGARAALAWVDVLMVEYHLQDTSHETLITEAAEADVGILVKKGLASGHLEADASIRFVLENRGVTSLVIGGLNLDHIRANIRAAEVAGL